MLLPMAVPAQCLERTLRVNVPGGGGAGFTITRHDRQWLVTARHVVEGHSASDIQLVWRAGPVTATVSRVPDLNPGADVAVFALDNPVTPELNLRATSHGLTWSQDVYFLGYPYGLQIRNLQNFPLVKKAIVSGKEIGAQGVGVWLLDGINNPGFSGGPVVFQREGTSQWNVAAVVSGFLTEEIAIAGSPLAVPANTGIILAYDVHHAIDAIDRYHEDP